MQKALRKQFQHREPGFADRRGGKRDAEGPERSAQETTAATALTKQEARHGEGEAESGARRSGSTRSGGRRSAREAASRATDAAASAATAGVIGRPRRELGGRRWGMGNLPRGSLEM
ncbi:hypothetical protein E2562_037057 [Oryza meyeriana var. granulata]|uniref:Uncharacterized protein n=1 Tax=Oryza meyeriana var. granulata TaxID=110450 RepID=A0A6G1ETN4_9ORYZ|nr:hypothetical protein E2562_037057 [Oryza meyeriana var. granulata]